MSSIKVIGIGGAGNNIINKLIGSHLEGIEYISVQSKEFSLSQAESKIILNLGSNITDVQDMLLSNVVKGAESERRAISGVLRGSDQVFIVAGLGGRLGSVGAYLVADVAKSMGIKAVSYVTMPFTFEGPLRRERAKLCADLIGGMVDSITLLSNDDVLRSAAGGTTLLSAFNAANDCVLDGLMKVCN